MAPTLIKEILLSTCGAVVEESLCPGEFRCSTQHRKRHQDPRQPMTENTALCVGPRLVHVVEPDIDRSAAVITSVEFLPGRFSE